MSVPSATQPSSVVAPASLCAQGAKPACLQPCAGEMCPRGYWLANTTWSPCSAPCVLNASDTSGLGVSTRAPPVCMVASEATGGLAEPVDDARCMDLGLALPPTSRPCNRGLCPSAVVAWSVGAWGPCVPVHAPPPGVYSSACASGPMHHTRSVTCRSTDGAEVADGPCAASTPKPLTSESCTGVPCTCSSDNDCSHPHKRCLTSGGAEEGGTCVCVAGWRGDTCDVPVTASVACPRGVVDAAGVCCGGNIDIATGRCCEGQGTAVDSTGRCCSPGQAVDVCGKCGGGGVAVDVQGTCCKSSLPPSGICCVSGVLDSCGVCDGDNQCGMALSGMVSVHSGARVTVTSIAAALRLPIDRVALVAGTPSPSPSPSPGEGNGTSAFRQLTASATEAWAPLPGTPMSAVASVPGHQPGPANHAQPEGARAAVEDFIIVSFVVLPATEQSGLSSEAVLASLLSMTDDSQPVWIKTPDVARVPACGNQQCEAGEACTTANCTGGTQCLADCPVNMAAERCALASTPSGPKMCSGHGTCLGLSGYCSCFSGYLGGTCSTCAPEYVLVSQGMSKSCVFLPGAVVTCGDGVRNGNEEGVDCGGSCVTACNVSATAESKPWWSKTTLKLSLICGGCAVLVIAVCSCTCWVSSDTDDLDWDLQDLCQILKCACSCRCCCSCQGKLRGIWRKRSSSAIRSGKVAAWPVNSDL